MYEFLIYSFTGVVVILAMWFVSYCVVYHVALFLFKWLMPLKNENGDSVAFKILIALPFTVGFLLDIYWNIIHFSFKLYMMNRADHLHKSKRFWPDFSKVDGLSTLYRITLTERLQFILDTYPLYTKAYAYALDMKELLNKYDADHLTLRKRS
jgi:hypothetical protein